MRKTVSLIAAVGFASALLYGCGTQQSSASKATAKKETPSKPPMTIGSVQITKNDGQNLDVILTADNNSNKAIYIHSSDFALSSGETTLTPTSQSNVPAQIPADSKTNIPLEFDVKGQLSGTITPKLAFQPSGNQPEQFKSMDSINIPVPQNPANQSTLQTNANQTTPAQTTQPSSSKPSASQPTAVKQSQPSPSMTYVPDNGGTIITLFFHNLGDYTPTSFDMVVQGPYGYSDSATITNIAHSDITLGSIGWNMVNGNIVYGYATVNWRLDTTIKVTCTAPGKSPITLSFPYKAP